MSLPAPNIFKSVFARKCKLLSNVARGAENIVSKEQVERFLAANHDYGYVKSPYCWALSYENTIVAAATFSKPRKINDIYSYEWTRYASPHGVRVVGGMGKILSDFLRYLKEEKGLGKVEIMSYADKEMGDGDAYKKLNFKKIGELPPIPHYIRTSPPERLSQKEFDSKRQEPAFNANDYTKTYNLGSIKYTLTVDTHANN